MKPRKLITSATLALSVSIAGIVQADLASDLQTMSPADALKKAAAADESISIETLISEAASQLKDNPGLLTALVSEAVKQFPLQAAQIVSVAISQAPQQAKSITSAAIAQLDNPVAIDAVQKAADTAVELIAKNANSSENTSENNDETESEAEQTETTADNTTTDNTTDQQNNTAPPPAPIVQPGNTDKPVPTSPNT